MKAVVARNPFANRRGIDPAKLQVTFLVAETTREACEQVLKMKIEPEELRFSCRELYIICPNGVGQPKLPIVTIFKILKTPRTARNWNSVTKLLEMAEAMEAELSIKTFCEHQKAGSQRELDVRKVLQQ
jgi:uncharacterized protein (DUF1697 family)